MLFVGWIPILLTVIFFIHTIYKEYDLYGFNDFVDGLITVIKGLGKAFVFWVISVIVGVVVLFIVSLALYGHVETTTEVEWVQPIKSVADNVGIKSRSFVLGTGYVESTLQYYYIKETDKGDIIGHISAEDCYTQESDKPALEKHYYKFKDKAWNLIAEPWQASYYVMKVPKDTIKYNYNIDLQ